MKPILPLVALVVVALSPATAQAFIRSSVNEAGEIFLFWRSRTVPFWLNEAGSRDAGQAASLQASRESYEVWTKPTCTDFKFEDRGTTSRTDVGFSASATDNLNLVVWREQTCASKLSPDDPCFDDPGSCANKGNCWDAAEETIAVTTTTFSKSTGELFDADIEFNGAAFVFTAVASGPTCPAGVTRPPPPTCIATDVKNTLVHEVGHVLGLDHVDGADATMAPTANDGETKKRSLAQDDIEGLCTIYPKGRPTPGVSEQVLVYGDGFACASGGAGAPASGALVVLAAALGRLRRSKATRRRG